MKFRNAFVSNSSTCSFVVLGFKAEHEDVESLFKDDLAKAKKKAEAAGKDFYEEDEVYDLADRHGINLDGSWIIGEVLAKESDYMMEDTEHCIQELHDMAKQIAEKYNVSISDISLYTGTRQC